MPQDSAEFRKAPIWKRFFSVVLVLLVVFAVVGAVRFLWPRPLPYDRDIPGVTAENLRETDADLFHDMDGAVALTSDEIKGRNTWMIWTAGNADFWNWLAQYGFGTNDLLKTLDSRNRGKRFATMGLINEPGFRAATQPDTFGLWLDERIGPPENVDTLGYGKPSGIVGLRLFHNPKFSRAKWDAGKYDTVPNYYNDPKLERPYIVGMSCAFCHIGPHPLYPPADPENPTWSNLSTNIGSQYFRTVNVFGGPMNDSSIVYQILEAMADGTLDTSFLATDNILNPSNMNAIFEVGGRLAAAQRNPEETVSEFTMKLKNQQKTARVPHILKDGADNIGLLGALTRVYINIGEYHGQWLRNHNILVGGKAQTPFSITEAQEKSLYWNSTESRVNNLAAFFLKAAGPMHLEKVPGSEKYLTANAATLTMGKMAFAEECASCHSSKQPPDSIAKDSAATVAWFRTEVVRPDFRDGNFFSDDRRHMVSKIQTNACRAVATNATRGHVWDRFSSETYKNSPPSDPIEVYDPFTKTTSKWQPPAGGPGYYRTPSLVSMWATAPYFHHNELGRYDSAGRPWRDPSVEGRMKAFVVGVEQLLWPEKRRNVNSIWRTTRESWLTIPTPFLPEFLRSIADDDGYLRIGPIPAGTPIKLLANLDMTLETPEVDRADAAKVVRLVNLGRKVKHSLLQIKLRNLRGEQAAAVMRELGPDLLAMSKCPDFIEDKGHYFGTKLSDEQKRALIEYLKTL